MFVVPLIFTYLGFLGVSNYTDCFEKTKTLFVKQELRLYSITPTTSDEDMVVIFDDKNRECDLKKLKENNRLVLVLSCDGKEGDTLDFTATSKKCPETRSTGYGKLGDEAEFDVQCQ